MDLKNRKFSKPSTEEQSLGTNSGGLSDKAILRKKADELYQKFPSTLHLLTDRNFIQPDEYLPDDKTLKLIYELEVHQLELELQNKELVLAKEQVEIAAEKYTELYDFSPAGYFTLSKVGDIVELNLYGSKLLGKERSLLINSRFNLFVSDSTRPIFNEWIESLFAGIALETCEVALIRNNQEPVYVHLSGIVAENREECLIAAIDITERVLAETELQNKNIELERVNAEKDKFYSIISHDLRGPFNGFLGLTQMMSEGLNQMTLEEIQKIASLMAKSANNLHGLLGNLLEWSRMQRGLTSFLPTQYFLKPKIIDSMSVIISQAKDKEIIINYKIAEGLQVYADGNMLDSILRNLVSNAVKFTPRGGKITILAKPLSNRLVQISIRDTGIGMDKTRLENLFRLDVVTNRIGTEGESSTGLGLILCKDFIERHGGELHVESKEGKGTTFSFTLPAVSE